MTGYELVTAIRGDDAAHHYRRARSLLADLAGIPIRREQVYTWRNEVDDAQFTLLAGVEWNGKALNRFTGRPSARGSSEVVILFSKFVTERFLRRRIKTLMLEPYLQLAGTQRGRSAEIAPLLYPKLDRELARKDEYHRTLVSLLDELGIRPCRYKSKRRLRVAPAVEALDGLPIQRGQFTLHVELRLSADEQDYVLVARKSRQTQLALS
jgi:hypothetical protein